MRLILLMFPIIVLCMGINDISYNMNSSDNNLNIILNMPSPSPSYSSIVFDEANDEILIIDIFKYTKSRTYSRYYTISKRYIQTSSQTTSPMQTTSRTRTNIIINQITIKTQPPKISVSISKSKRPVIKS